MENYIEDTKQSIVDNLHLLYQNNKPNLTEKQQIALNKLQKNRKSITIKPADKNLGLVLMNTDHYIMQCLAHLTDTSTYRLTTSYPLEDIERNMVHILNNFKHELDNRDKRLYKFLQKSQQTTRVPCFYGIPKIHKKFARLPPLCPIVSQSTSPLIGTAKFIDHVLQPVASSYPDYLHNTTALSITLQDLKVPEDAILVTIDVTSLYPSIPQTECLNVIYDELYTHRFLLTFNPNLIIRLLHLNINYNYFTFDKLVFQQIEGTAMGAPFSPTVANIFMSIVLKRFLATQPIKPLILKRYIDDIIMIWTNTKESLTKFLSDLNSFHPKLHFTHERSTMSIDFLDLTVYKGPFFEFTNVLDTKTFQKGLNLYQYLHYASYHPHNVFKAIIIGECIRYVRTNTTSESYIATLNAFTTRLRERGFPEISTNKTTNIVDYNNRNKYLQNNLPTGRTIIPPLYKTYPPPQFVALKQLVLKDLPPLASLLFAT